MLKYLVSTLLLVSANTCSDNGSHYSTQSLDSVWLQGKAEISTYDLYQNRYRDLHPGEAVIVTVSEPWHPGNNVKSDSGGESTTTVLKTNQVRQFTTGIYDYSIFTSTFVQPDGYLEKITCSSQDWCGQSWLQIIGADHSAEIEQRSYFEQEGDRIQVANTQLSEDGLINQIRIDPKQLPSGEVALVPAAHYLLMRHLPLEAIPALVSQSVSSDTVKLHIKYPTINRDITFLYAVDAPHTIYGWQDTYPSAFDGQARTTEAVLRDTAWHDYWKLNRVQDTVYRQPLGLD